MSQIPRRTSEFQPSSAKRPTRNSRITSSVSRPSTSAAAFNNRMSAAATSNVRPSTTFSRVSATPMRTPAKTPNRSGSRDRMTVVQMTAEKEKAPTEDRDYIYTKSQQVLDELSKQDRFNELVQKGLKSMTLKTFISILEYFLEPICGSVPKDFQTNYIDFLYNLLLQLEYPFNINKSSLKTPNAPHCLNNIIILLGWLADFSKVDEEAINYKVTDQLQDIESMKVFMEQSSEAYKQFNDEKDYSDIERKVRETFLEMRGIVNSDIETEKEKLRYEIEQLQKESKPLSLLKELNEKKKQSTELDQKIEAHNKNIGDYNRAITNLKSNLALKQQTQDNVQKELTSLNHQLKTQLMTLDKRQQILIEITHLKSALMSKQNAVMDLKEASSENEIALSNLISKKYQLIDRLNNLIYKLSSDLDIAGTTDEFDPEHYVIKSSNDDANMDRMLNQMYKGLSMLKNKYFQMQSDMKEHIMKTEAEKHNCKTQKEILDVKLQQIQKTFEQVENEESIVEQELSALIHNLQTNYHERKEKIKQNEKAMIERTKGLEQLRNEIKELQEKREDFGAKAVAQCEKLLKDRQHEVEDRRQFLSENSAAIDHYHRNKERLPQELENMLENVRQIRKQEDKENMQES
ncbi:kinetochore protein NDC80 homolog [Chironomus tepperi]|uniref:kinetochore protein NDC80 homolog n=1 Tax=Chironomus tepperi TaxID=113505 RepID=UPI00391F050B